MRNFFQNKVIVITGASSGLGRAIALALAPFGCKMAGISRNIQALQQLSREINSMGSVMLPIACDVSRQDQCLAAIEKILTEWKHIDILINNAGITNISLFHPDKHIDITHTLMNTNFFGALYCTTYAFKSILSRRGSIVIISSVAGFSPLVGRTAYAASKHALHGFFNSLKAELRQAGVHVMLVCPQFIKTAIRTDKPHVVVGKELLADDVAQKILQGLVKKKSFLPIGKTAIFAWYLNRLLPNVYEYLMCKSQMKKITANNNNTITNL